jgi:hypothetical protein
MRYLPDIKVTSIGKIDVWSDTSPKEIGLND